MLAGFKFTRVKKSHSLCTITNCSNLNGQAINGLGCEESSDRLAVYESYLDYHPGIFSPGKNLQKHIGKIHKHQPDLAIEDNTKHQLIEVRKNAMVNENHKEKIGNVESSTSITIDNFNKVNRQ